MQLRYMQCIQNEFPYSTTYVNEIDDMQTDKEERTELIKSMCLIIFGLEAEPIGSKRILYSSFAFRVAIFMFAKRKEEQRLELNPIQSNLFKRCHHY